MEIEILETSDIIKNTEKPIFIIGFPDVGLVGTIATYHIVEKLNLKEVAHIDSEKFPPIVVVHDAKPSSPIRIYGNGKIFVVISEIPIRSDLIPHLSKNLVKWFKEKNASLVVSLGGIPHPKRLEIDKPEVYGVGSNEKLNKKLEKLKVKPFEEGIIVGIHGIILRKCIIANLPSIYLMAESHYKYPDPEAAASIIEVINKISNLSIDVK